ncbi:beta-1,3-galactosyltransferase brn-like [Ylistrum balloti]|uniref:beta-1,3-galactosyltransferase brn-like n=1 Tax=Ylistrum balloti TaxID=509963 RepID=UPI002905E8F8|nr:beta-1,3-galactosyltransferase brn-like [Ylistrum balloti]
MNFPKRVLASFALLSIISVLILTLYYLNIGPNRQHNGCIAAKEWWGNDSNLYSLENPRWLSELRMGIKQHGTVATPFFNNTNYTSYPLDIDMMKLVREYREGSQNASLQKINEYPYRFLTKPEVRCTKSTKLLLVIKSSPENRKSRQTLRDTWGNEERIFGIKRVFVLARTKTFYKDVEQEIKTHGDILQIDYEDSYYMNTWKTRGALLWAGYSCQESDYVLLADDDYYVATDLLLQQLEITGSCNESLYMGWVNPRSFPFRTKSSKWYISTTDYPYKIYPPFVSAGSIVMSMKFVMDFIIASQYTKHIIFDDVFLAIVANKLGVVPLSNNLFYTGKVEYWNDEFWNTLTAHGYRPSDLKNAWQCHILLKKNGLGKPLI